MADKEVADLPSAILPLVGTELVTVVQSGNSRKVPVNDLLGTGLANLDLTVSQIALQVADVTNVALFLGPTGNRVADSFDALTYVDVAGATNLDTSASGLLKPTISSGASYANTGGTGNRTASITVTTTMTAGGGTLSALVNGNTLESNYYWGVQTVAGKYVRFDFGAGAAKYVSEFKLYKSATTTQGIWKWQGSNDASVWTDIGLPFTLHAGATSAVPSVSIDTELAKATALYRYIQMVGVSGNSTDEYEYEVEFKLDTALPAAGNVSVRSASFTAAAAPTKMKALIRVKEIDAATAGIDYTLECSRDGGTTWSAMTLSELFTSPSPTASIRVVEAAETSVSGQPSGTSPRWRFKTLNNKSVELHDALLYWS